MKEEGLFENKIILRDMEEIYKRDVDWRRLDGKTILITGAYGMLASYVTYFLIYLNEMKEFHTRILILVRNEEKARNRFGKYCTSDYFKIFTNSLEKTIEITEKVDYIIHAASLASPEHYSIHPVDVLVPNSLGTYYLLKKSIEDNIEGFLFFSTCDIYGKVEKAASITENTMGYIDPIDLHSCYGESKRLAETMCMAFAHQYGVPTKIARIWHTYGPMMDIANDPRVFSSFMKCLLEGRNIEMLSNGNGKRSFCYITDAVAGYYKILLDGRDGEPYNVCNSNTFISIKELANIISSLDLEGKVKVITKERDKEDHYLENLTASDICPSNSKLKELGWECLVDVKEGFSRVYEYYAKNR